MNKNKKSTIKSSAQRGNGVTDNIDGAPLKKGIKVDVGNDSPQHSCDSRFSGHSTPIRKKDYAYDIEDSLELDNRCSPISLPCTQDGGDEVHWDWLATVNKSSKDKSKSSNANVETPKRTKQLQKKRNSNSPLLQKPHKRKLLKVENIENIGKLTAELRALSERMKSMQQDFKDHTDANETDIKCESKRKLLIDINSDSSDDIIVEMVVNNDDKPKIITNNNNKKNSNYEDLFDDSIEDSMVRCSQEIEEKLNLCKSKGNDLFVGSKERELFSISETETNYLTTSNSSTENSRSSSTAKSTSVSSSSHLRTYSNNSSKTNHSNVSLSKVSNRNITDEPARKGIFQERNISQIPDDSFDDCLATCIEDDKLLSKVSEYEFIPSVYSYDINCSKKTSKQAVSNTSDKNTSNNRFLKVPPQNGGFSNHQDFKLITDELIDEIEIINDREAIRKSLPGKNSLEKRKFFKTKSLSDQYFYQNKSASVNCKTNQPSNSVMPSEKRFQSNSVNSSVSTTSFNVKGPNPNKGNNFSSINGMGNARALNRLEENEDKNCIVKYKSTSNLSNTKEALKESQPVPCTPAEIEKKRLEAKMKLEAKRKLKQTKTRIANVPSKAPVTKSVKR
ncbi:hypothetical protein ANTQUA_LOCUS7603 [Anthophora quadrimaculata]